MIQEELIIHANAEPGTLPVLDFIKQISPEGETPWRPLRIVRNIDKTYKKPIWAVNSHAPKETWNKFQGEEWVGKYQVKVKGAMTTKEQHIKPWTEDEMKLSDDNNQIALADLNPIRWIKDKSKNKKYRGELDEGVVLQNHIELRGQYIPNLVIIDEDEDEVKNPHTAPDAKKRCEEFLKDCPYTKSAKGRHYYLLVSDIPEHTNGINVFEQKALCKGDLLGASTGGANVYEDLTRLVYNFNGALPMWHFDKLKAIMSTKFWNSVKDRTRVPPGKNKATTMEDLIIAAERIHGEKLHAPEPMDKADEFHVTKFKRYVPTHAEWNSLLLAADPDCDYDTWRDLGFAGRTFQEDADWVNGGWDWAYFEIYDKWSSGAKQEDKYPGTESLKQTWDEYGFGRMDASLPRLGWTRAKRIVKETWPEAYERGFSERLIKKIGSFPAVSNCQEAQIYALVMDMVMDDSIDSNFIASSDRNNKDLKSWTMFDEKERRWLNMVNGQATTQKQCWTTIVPRLENLMTQITDRYGDDFYDKDWKEDNPKIVQKYNTLLFTYKSFSSAATAAAISIGITTLCMNEDRHRSIDSADETRGGRVRYLFPFNGHVVEMLTGKVRRPVKEDMISDTTGYKFPLYLVDVADDGTFVLKDDFNADVTELMLFFETLFSKQVKVDGTEVVLAGTEDVVDFYLKEFAASLPCGCLWQSVIVCTGDGGNGKTDLFQFMKRIFGDLAGTLKSTYWNRTEPQGGAPDSELMAIRSKRLVVSEEVPKGKPVRSDILKRISGGGDETGRELQGTTKTFELYMKCWLNSNHQLEFTDVDAQFEALERRISNIQFPFAFSVKHLKNANYSYGCGDLAKKIKTNLWRDLLTVILLIEFKSECVKVNDEGEPYVPSQCPWEPPDSVKQNTRATLQQAEDHFDRFYRWAFAKPKNAEEEENYPDSFRAITQKKAYELYQEFCSEASIEFKLGEAMVGKKMTNKGPRGTHSSGQILFIGIKEVPKNKREKLKAKSGWMGDPSSDSESSE